MNTLLDWRSKLQRWCFSWYAPLVIKGIISKPELVPYEDTSRWKEVTFMEISYCSRLFHKFADSCIQFVS
jgi:hypothetical protein